MKGYYSYKILAQRGRRQVGEAGGLGGAEEGSAAQPTTAHDIRIRGLSPPLPTSPTLLFFPLPRPPPALQLLPHFPFRPSASLLPLRFPPRRSPIRLTPAPLIRPCTCGYNLSVREYLFACKIDSSVCCFCFSSCFFFLMDFKGVFHENEVARLLVDV